METGSNRPRALEESGRAAVLGAVARFQRCCSCEWPTIMERPVLGSAGCLCQRLREHESAAIDHQHVAHQAELGSVPRSLGIERCVEIRECIKWLFSKRMAVLTCTLRDFGIDTGQRFSYSVRFLVPENLIAIKS
jgi:hypothetical protein